MVSCAVGVPSRRTALGRIEAATDHLSSGMSGDDAMVSTKFRAARRDHHRALGRSLAHALPFLKKLDCGRRGQDVAKRGFQIASTKVEVAA